MVRPLGIALPISGARGWLVQLAPGRPLVRRWIQSGARRLLAGHEPVSATGPPSTVTAREFAEGAETRDVTPMIQPAPDGSIVAGSSRETALTADAHGLEVPRRWRVRRCAWFRPSPTRPWSSTWSGVRPISPDERPLIGPVLDGLLVAGGHGSEGVILGGGTAQLVRAMVTGESRPFDAAPFDPHRFELGARPGRRKWSGPVHPVE